MRARVRRLGVNYDVFGMVTATSMLRAVLRRQPDQLGVAMAVVDEVVPDGRWRRWSGFWGVNMPTRTDLQPMHSSSGTSAEKLE